jgi:lysophospholipase L1-like esterase
MSRAPDTLASNMIRHLRHAALYLLLPLAVAAQTPAPSVPAATTAPAAPTGPRTTIPSDSNELSRPKNYQDCRDRVAAANAAAAADPTKHIDLLFVGDSITEAWSGPAWGGYQHGAAVWEKVYAPRNALNFGVGADRTQHLLYRLDTMDVKQLTPKVIVLMIGTNNNIDTAPDIAAGVHAVLTKLQTMYPAAKIILVSILPNARATQLMADANALIKPFADGRTIFYFDLAALMPPVGDNWLGLSADHLHHTEVGYQIWADNMEPLLTQLLATPAPEAATQPKH